METIADIVAEMRAKTAKSKDEAWYDKTKWAELFNRIEMAELHQRVKDMDEAYNNGYGDAQINAEAVTECNQPVTNCHALNLAKMREALETISKCDISKEEDCYTLYRVCEAALSAPARNCDRLLDSVTAIKSYQEETGLNKHPVPLWTAAQIYAFIDWLFCRSERRNEMSKFYDIAKTFVADESRKALSKPFVYEGYPYATDGKIAYWGHIMCPEQESEDTHIAAEIKKLILEAHKGKQFSFEFDDEFVDLAKCDYQVKLRRFLAEEKEEKEKYDGGIMYCPHCGEKVYYTGYDLIEVEDVEDPKESDFLYAVEVEGLKYNWRYIQMMMSAIPTGKWYVTKVKNDYGDELYGLMRHSEEATAYMLASFPDTETQLKAKIKKGANDEQ